MSFDPIQTASTIAAVVIAATRVLNAAKPAWSKVPEPFYSFLPVLVLVLPDLAARLAGVQTGTDLTVELVTALSLLVPAPNLLRTRMRSARRTNSRAS
jgi:hypothetical protein